MWRIMLAFYNPFKFTVMILLWSRLKNIKWGGQKNKF